MIRRKDKTVQVCVAAAFAVAAVGAIGAQPAGVGGGVGAGAGVRGLSIKDMVRVEQLRGDSGGLSRSLARGPADLAAPNDFSGVYQIPDDADTPYAGWFARASGATIAVFPRGDYKAGPDGMMPVIPANTRFFLGSIPLGGGGAGTRKAPANGALANERVNSRVDDRWQMDERELTRMPAPDAPQPLTVETAKDLDGVREAMGKLCGDPVYRANRVRALMERAAATTTADAK